MRFLTFTPVVVVAIGVIATTQGTSIVTTAILFAIRTQHTSRKEW
ncbi:hypothetical protein ACSTEP_10035 [Vibrio vulnificus]